MGTTLTIKHYGRVVNGKKVYLRPDILTKNLEMLEGEEFEEIIKKKAKAVSSRSKGFYFGGIIRVCSGQEMFGGWTEDDIHDYFAGMFLSHYAEEKAFNTKKETFTKTVQKVKSISSLNSKEMSEYIEKVISWLAYHGIEIETPEQYKNK